jgi:predicted amidophosphoribosyltransferase
VLVPPTCPICLRPGDAPCPSCASTLRPAPGLAAPGGVDRCVALFAYEGAGAALVRALKFANHRDASRAVGRALATLVADERPCLDVVTFVPASVERRRRNGFDHAEVLARATARPLGIACRRTLRRAVDGGAHQTGRGRSDRLAGPPLAPANRRGGAPSTVLVIDDVRTTGASLSAAAAVLRGLGATRIVAATMAATPEHPRR